MQQRKRASWTSNSSCFAHSCFPRKTRPKKKVFIPPPPLPHPLGFAPSTFPVWVISAGLFFSPSWCQSFRVFSLSLSLLSWFRLVLPSNLRRLRIPRKWITSPRSKFLYNSFFWGGTKSRSREFAACFLLPYNRGKLFSVRSEFLRRL